MDHCMDFFCCCFYHTYFICGHCLPPMRLRRQRLNGLLLAVILCGAARVTGSVTVSMFIEIHAAGGRHLSCDSTQIGKNI